MRIENGRDSVTRLRHTEREREVMNDRLAEALDMISCQQRREGGREGGLVIIPIYHALYSRETDREID